MHLLAALCCSKRHNSGFSILLKDTSACRFGKTGDQTADLQVGGRPLYPSATATPTSTAVHMEPFSTSAFKVLVWIFATTTKICTRGGSTRARALGFCVPGIKLVWHQAYHNGHRIKATMIKSLSSHFSGLLNICSFWPKKIKICRWQCSIPFCLEQADFCIKNSTLTFNAHECHAWIGKDTWMNLWHTSLGLTVVCVTVTFSKLD